VQSMKYLCSRCCISMSSPRIHKVQPLIAFISGWIHLDIEHWGKAALLIFSLIVKTLQVLFVLCYMSWTKIQLLLVWHTWTQFHILWQLPSMYSFLLMLRSAVACLIASRRNGCGFLTLSHLSKSTVWVISEVLCMMAALCLPSYD
jgi:hypothetical protein